MAHAAAVADGANLEFSFPRLFDAPRTLAFEADPARLSRWWGPRGFTTPVCELDARPGGEKEGGRTRLHVRNRFRRKADRDAHLKMGATEGWSQSFEKLGTPVGAPMESL
jgi:uncharacterized protein YndB with AHSA1/START domain